jgi:uncharacterized protein (DUF433 family)
MTWRSAPAALIPPTLPSCWTKCRTFRQCRETSCRRREAQNLDEEVNGVAGEVSLRQTPIVVFDQLAFGSGRSEVAGRVKDVLEMLAGDATREEILEDYPFLEPEDILACLEYAAEQVNHPVLIGA